MNNEKKYFAFISYKREDEKWAVWLQHKLEHYKLPSNLNGRTDLPKEIRPIFRDQSELAGGVLADEIQKALEASKYLIVICSPRAAHSQWVGKEVQSFIDMGRTDKIIPFIIGGAAHAQNPEDECFPSALLNLPPEQELLGINIDEMGRDAASVKVIAQMFGLKFDTLWQRYEREQRKKRNTVVFAVVILLLFVFGVAVWILSQNKRITQQDKELEEKEWKKKENMALAVAKQALELSENGESQLATLLALEVLPKRLDNPDLPYTIEAEIALRESLQDNSFVLNGHSKKVNTAFFSHDGRWIVSASDDNTLKIWDVRNGVCVKTCWHNAEVNKAVFSYDDKKIASVSNDKTIRIWDASTGECIHLFSDAHDSAITSVYFCFGDEKIITSSYDSIKLWDLKSFDCVQVMEGHAIMSNDGTVIATTSNKSDDIRFLDANTLICTSVVTPDEGLSLLSFSSNNKEILATDMDENLVILDAETGKIVHNMDERLVYGSRFMINSAAFGRDDKSAISVSSDMMLRIWDIYFEEVVYEHMYNNTISSVAYSPDYNSIVCAFDDNTVRVIDLNPGRYFLRKEIDEVVYDPVVVASPQSNSIAYEYKNYVCIYDVDKLMCSNVMGSPCVDDYILNSKLEVRSFKYSKDGSMLVYATSDTIKIWDVKSQQLCQVFADNSHGEISTIEISPDNKRIASLYRNLEMDTLVKIWDVNIGKCIHTLSDYSGIILVSFNNDGTEMLSVSKDNTIKIWNMETGGCTNTLIGHNAHINEASFNHDGTIVLSASDDNTIKLWDVNKAESINTFGVVEEEPDYYETFVFRPYGERLMYGGVNDAFFSSDEERIFSAYNDNTIKIWDVKTGECRVLEGHVGPVRHLNCNQEDNRIVSYSDDYLDNTVKVWDVETGKCVQTFYGEGEWINCAGWCFDQKNIYCSSHGGTIRIWSFPPLQELIDETRERFKDRPLTPEERHQYYLE